MSKKLVLITGTGRSGTSTLSGAFHHLGLSVPGPYLGANESNPKGFYESKWAVRFHKDIAQAAAINDFDGRPTALDRARAVVTPALHQRLRDFLTEQSAASDQVVVKDPRTVWAQWLWAEVASEVGLDLVFVSMLRHPAEVIGSRSTYYANADDDRKRARYQTMSLARWVNNSLVNERETRDRQRALVGYADLLTDWRPVLDGLAERFGLVYDPPTSQRPHPVDEFIDPDLRRHSVSWDAILVPAELKELSERIWAGLAVLQAAGGDSPEVSADFDRISQRYAALVEESFAISHDAVSEAVTEAREAGARDAARQQKAAARAAATKPAAPPRPAGRLVDETRAVDLLKVVARRGARRFRRR